MRCAPIQLLGALVAALATIGVPAPADAQVIATPHLDTNVAGDVETERGGVGLSLGYYVRVWRGLGLGLELDAAWHQHFFRDTDVAHLVPEGVDLNTDALMLMNNLVVPVSIPRAPIWRPYATVGAGMTHATFTLHGGAETAGKTIEPYQNDPTFNAGIGILHQLTRVVGLRVDVRYVHAFVDEDARKGGYFNDYAFWRVAVGFTFGLPPQRWPDAW
jgi:hypothetical protein